MPRIAAAIGVFAVIAFCIFFNIKRYPAVWDMVGASPWFAKEANTSPQDHSPQPIKIAENNAPEKTLPEPQPEPEEPVHQTLPSLKPRLADRSTPTNDLQVETVLNKADSDKQDSKKGETQTAKTKTEQKPAYQGFSHSPIKFSSPVEPVGQNWPAEMSPRMKYAAKPPLLESYQQWNPERPVVPVVQPGKFHKKEKTKTFAEPDPKDSSKIEPEKKTGPASQSDNEDVVRRLPMVNPKQRPIRISIQGSYLGEGIPVYPSTGQ